MPSVGDSRSLPASDLLESIAVALAAMPDSPQKRQLGAKAESYRLTIASWRASPPTSTRREALEEMVLALYKKLAEVLRRASLDLTPGGATFGPIDEDDDDAPPSSTPIARLALRGKSEKA